MVGRAHRTFPTRSESPMSLLPQSNPDPVVAEVGCNPGPVVVVAAAAEVGRMYLVSIVGVVAK